MVQPIAASEPRHVFEIFRNRVGQWCARRLDGLVFGMFVERDAAVRFARRECLARATRQGNS